MELNIIKRLKEDINCPLIVAKKALELCDDNYDVAKEFIRYKYSGVARYKIVNGKKVPFADEDYVAWAKKGM